LKKIWFEIVLGCLDFKKIGEKIFSYFFSSQGKDIFEDWSLFLWKAGRCKTVTFGNFRHWTVFWPFSQLCLFVISL